MMSDDSENDGIYVENNFENDIYYKKYKLLLERCECIQKHNEQLVYRIHQVKKITKYRLEDVRYFKERLTKLHGEYWDAIPRIDLDEEEEIDVKPSVTIKVKIKQELPDELQEEKIEKPKATKKGQKRKSKVDRDPNAPKRPSNPFFQFCQEQRQKLMGQITSELKPGETEPSKQELTRQLALKWKTLSGNDKKVYVDMYERSKEKYAMEMSEYNMKK